ncbi:hypothetical protein DH2020_020339 [Rehmannia glutinosa]|uniref:Reverse transcriptase Ty1/copia-type domain-containing protein n=1 Tax=Rehmannia glutinosa TaxID=99300 RepID=A0ABR0WJZ9_REHGL
MSDINSNKWQEATQSEIDSMYSNKVWTLMDLPQGIVPIGFKWVYKQNLGVDGEVATFKARLVAKGSTQKQGVDYDETFSPVVMLKFIRILLAISAYYDYEIWQMDVKTIFLNGNIKEKKVSGSAVAFVVLYVDDILLIGNDVSMLQSTRTWLSKQFSMKDLGEVSFYPRDKDL